MFLPKITKLVPIWDVAFCYFISGSHSHLVLLLKQEKGTNCEIRLSMRWTNFPGNEMVLITLFKSTDNLNTFVTTVVPRDKKLVENCKCPPNDFPIPLNTMFAQSAIVAVIPI